MGSSLSKEPAGGGSEHTAAAAAAAAPGAHTGQLLARLPVGDLLSPRGGAWNTCGRLRWNNSSIVDLPGGGQAICVRHDRGSGTSADAKVSPEAVGGISVSAVPRGLPVSEGGVVLAFDAWWPLGYQWARGGKIGGIAIGTGRASGGRHSVDGASGRLMWQTDGGAILYAYVPAGSQQPDPRLQGDPVYGHGVFKREFAGALQQGRWNRIEIGVKLNTIAPGGEPIADGMGSLTVNGVTHTISRVVWRLRAAHQIESVGLNEFFGGPLPSPVDQECYYANFSVHRWKD